MSWLSSVGGASMEWNRACPPVNLFSFWTEFLFICWMWTEWGASFVPFA
jgi:hypothetical protein